MELVLKGASCAKGRGAFGEGTANTEALRREERGFSRTLGRTYVCVGPSIRGEGDAGQDCRHGRDHSLQDASEELGLYSVCLFVCVRFGLYS